MKRLLYIAIITASIISACSKDSNPNDSEDPLKKEKEYTLTVMNDIYYWYDQVPQNIKPGPIPTLEEYFDTLLSPVDRWSWMMTGSEYKSMETGEYKIYGASFGQPIDYYNDYSIRVRYVFDNSPMSENGVKRGYELTHLNGIPVSTLIQNNTINTVLAQQSNTFTFKDYSGNSFTFSTSSRTVSTRSSLRTIVFTPSDFPGLPYNVGYFNYYTFNNNMLSDISSAMATFKNANIQELILDLRYNGGGDGDALEYIANLIAPETAQGQILGKRKHNNKYSAYDVNTATMTIINRNVNSLNLNRVIILTSPGTASASEVLLNGLRPLMNVIQVGRVTYGKPNGMYVIPYPESDYTNPTYVLLPICFYTVNKNGYGAYENGLSPDHSRPDDLYHDFGKDEDWIKASLTYIATGSFTAFPPVSSNVESSKTLGRLKTDEEQINYGKLLYRLK